MIPPSALLLPEAADFQWKQKRISFGIFKPVKSALEKQVVG